MRRRDVTSEWIRNRSDELAVNNGCTFDVLRGSQTVFWIERFCRLYEGATGPMRLVGCHQCGLYDLPDVTEAAEWDESRVKDILVERASLYAQCVRHGHAVDWQYECTMRFFGWVTHSAWLARMVRRFREASIWVSKKNKKSPTLASWATYTLAGDGEVGQKVYLAAKDGKQAREIAGGHVLKMIEKSPELSEECTINKNLYRVTHHPSDDSWLQPLSSANERTQKSKEGLNGSVYIDEVHVVDRKFANRINRAGISRDEPIHAEFSTAGDDPDEYGFERFEIAQRVESGELENQGMFVAIYAAPQNLSDEDLKADPLKYARMANPAMGHTVNPEEFLQDYKQSSISPASFAIFKKYRLNIWQNTASPWLDMPKWRAGARDVALDDYRGHACWAALDLASVKDFCALTLCFPEADDEYMFFWWFWLPEDTKRAYRDLIPIDKWLADRRCKLMLTPGARTDYGYISSTFRELAEQFDIQQLLYDDWNAEKVTQEISEGVRDNKGNWIAPGTDIERVNFGQGVADMNEPTKHFEGLVLVSKCLHNGDPLATWMAGNATVKPDSNGNYKPMKPKEGIKKIDGIITAVMSLAGAEGGGGDFHGYDTPGSFSL
jgi:phage terminase large subunit-like protein